jgi:iron complex transport system substrate-binding protein
MRQAIFSFITTLCLALTASAQPTRIVTAGSAVTEIACALGLGPSLVGVDTSSKHLDETKELPDIGYVRALSAEGVLSLKPDLVIVSSEAGPPPALQQISAAGVNVVTIPRGESLDAIADKIRAVATATGTEAKADALIAQTGNDTAALRTLVQAQKKSPRVVFLMARHGGNMAAGGTDTAAHAMIKEIGATNAAESFSGYKPLTPEFFASNMPEFIIISESVVGDDTQILANLPGMSDAADSKKPQIVRVDDSAFLGFGPRTPSAAKAVATALQSE